nr:hypothetical protein [Leuven Picorna-like virus 12]
MAIPTITYFGIKYAAFGAMKAMDCVLNSEQRADELDGPDRDHAFECAAIERDISMMSVAFPPTFGRNSEHYNYEEIEKFWIENPTVLATTRGIMTVGENICLRLLSDSEPIGLTQAGMLEILSKKVKIKPGTVFKTAHTDLKIRWKHVISAIHKLNYVIDDKNISKIQQYNRLIKVLAKLNGANRYYLTRICEIVYEGPIENLVLKVDLRNMAYITSILKPINSTALIHKLVCSPTWKGKVAALVQLIELFNVDLMEVTTNSIASIANMVLKIINYIMEKTAIGVDYLKKKFDWKRAKEPEEIEMQAIGDSCRDPACKLKPAFGCSLCISHYCKDHKICKCPIDYEHSIANCDCSNNQDCWYRAVAANFGQTSTQIKNRVHEFLNTNESLTQIQNLLKHLQVESVFDAEQIVTGALEQLNCNIQCEVETHLVTSLAMKCNITISSEIENKMIGLMYKRNSRWCKVRHYNQGAEGCSAPHFEYSKDIPYSKFDRNIAGSLINDWFIDTTPIPSNSSIPETVLCPDLATYKNEQLEKDLAKTAVKGVNTFEVSSADMSDVSYANKSYIENVTAPLEAQSVDREMHANAFEASRKQERKQESRQNTFSNWFKSETLSDVFQCVKDWLCNASKEVIEWFDENPLFSGIFSVIAGIASFFGLYVCMPTTKTGMSGIIKRFSDAGRVMHYTKNGFSGIANACTDVMSQMRQFLGIAQDREIMEFKENVANTLVKCKEMLLEAQTTPAKFVNNARNFHEFRDNMVRIMESYKNIAKTRSVNSRDLAVLNPVWFNLTRTYERLSMLYTKFVNGMSTRKVPVCAYFYGPTGIGKSAMMTQICNDLNRASNTEMKIFTVSKGTDHWNNYSQQEIIRFDDMNAVVGPEGDIDSIILFNLITDAPFNPNQASLEDKLTMANPSYVICASNFPSLPNNSIIGDIQAWESRRHFCVNVTFPEHAECKIRDPKCEHFKNLSITNFDHLTLTMVDPCMSQMETNQNKFGKIFKTVTPIADQDEIVAQGSRVSYGDLIKEMVDLEKVHNQRYKDALEEALKAGTAAKLQATTYEKLPTFALIGPPCTGKSHVFEYCAAIIQDVMDLEFCHIKTIAEAEEFLEKFEHGKVTAKFVIIDDFSTFLGGPDSTKLIAEKFNQIIRERHNVPKEGFPFALYVGVNQECYEKQFGHEMFNQVFRRCEQGYSRFRKMTFAQKRAAGVPISKLFKDKYCDRNTVKANPENIDEFVEYIYNERILSQQNLANEILECKPKIKQIKLLTRIPEITKTDATCMTNINVTEDELVTAINSGKLGEIFSIFKKCEIKKSKSSKFTTTTLLGHIQSLVTKCKNQDPKTISSLDELFIQSYNSHFFEFLKGECAVLKLNDYCISIDYTNEEVFLGKIVCVSDDLKEICHDLEAICDFSTKGILDTLGVALLPPWILLASEAIMGALHFIGTGLATGLTVYDQDQMFKAYASELKTEKIFEAAREAHADTGHKSIMKKFNLHPGLANVTAPQYGNAVDLLTYEDENHVVTDDGVSRARSQLKPKRETSPNRLTSQGSGRNVRLNRETSPSTVCSDTSSRSLREDDMYSKNQGRRNRKVKGKGASLQSALEYADRSFVQTDKTKPVMESSLEEIKIQVDKDGKITSDFSEEHVELQIASDPQLFSIISLVVSNACEILSNTGKRLCSGLFVGGKIVRTVAHVLDNNADNLRVRTLDGQVWRVEVAEINETLDRLDLRIVDKSFKSKPSISHHFPSVGKVISEGTTAVLITPKIMADGIMSYSIRSYIVKNNVMKEFPSAKRTYYCIDYRGHRLGYLLDGLVQTTNGDCGSVLIVADRNLQSGKIIGLHMAGTEHVAYASPLYKEDYAEPELQCLGSDTVIPSSHFDICEEDFVIGRCKDKNHISGKTRLFRNWYPIGEKCYEPSILSSSDPRCKVDSMLVKETQKWCEDPVELSVDIKNILWETTIEVANHFVDIMQVHNVSLRTLTKREALNKIYESTHSEPINVHTSPGYPWSKNTKKPGKMDYISVLDDGSRAFNKANLDKIGKLHNSIDTILNEDLTKPGKLVPFQIFLKDETIKLKKIYCEASEQKTRTIAAAPLDFQIAFRMYFHVAHARMMDLFAELPIKVGINPLSLDWHQLFMKLSAKSCHVVASDYKGWDFSHNPFFVDLLDLFYDILYKELDPKYSEDDKRVRSVLYRKIKKFFCVVGNSLWRTKRGIPSGYPGTTPDNSIINYILGVTAWKILMKKSFPALANHLSYKEDVEDAIYADDKLQTVSDWAIKHYNGLTLPPVMEKLGFHMQPAAKDDIYRASEHVKEGIFLSRNFVKNRGYWMGALLSERLLKTSWYMHDTRSHYFWESPDDEVENVESVVSAYESMLYEASMHGEGMFNLVRKEALKVFARTRLRVPPTYNECVSRLFGNTIDTMQSVLEQRELKILLPFFERAIIRPPNYVRYHNRECWAYGPDYSWDKSNINNKHNKHTMALCEQINIEFGTDYNSVLFNDYPIGGEIPWHQDNEPMLNKEMGIVGYTIRGNGRLELKGQGINVGYFQTPGYAYKFTEEQLLDFFHRRVSHSERTITATFRRIEVPQ